MRICPWITGVLSVIAPLLFAQTSDNYKLTEYTFNNGGNPSPVLSSSSYQMTLDAIGDGLSAQGLASTSYGMDGGFANAYSPPGEVQHLRFSDKTHLAWDPEPTVGNYDLYYGPLSDLPSFNYGDWATCGIAGTTAPDPSGPPTVGNGTFFLVTASNRINEEGTMGRTSGGVLRTNPGLCP